MLEPYLAKLNTALYVRVHPDRAREVVYHDQRYEKNDRVLVISSVSAVSGLDCLCLLPDGVLGWVLEVFLRDR